MTNYAKPTQLSSHLGNILLHQVSITWFTSRQYIITPSQHSLVHTSVIYHYTKST